MSQDEPEVVHVLPEEETGNPALDALNAIARKLPTLHDPAEVAAFMESIKGLPDAGERYERFIQEIVARYTTWAKENGIT